MRTTGNKDTIYAALRDHIGSFVFDEAVADVFPDMIRRSVPGYATALAMTGLLAARYAQPGTRCYDLGCSLGAATLAMSRGAAGKGCEIVAVDNAPAMVEKCRTNFEAAGLETPVALLCQDLRETVIEHASVVVLNYTLQFVRPDERLAVLKNICDGLLPGGVLMLSEKIAFSDPEEQALMTALHMDYKRAHGYSELEISQKRTALENVLIPETLDTHFDGLKRAGFGLASVFFRCLNFASILAEKR